MTTKKNKRFDAVAESRKWRIKTGAILATMTPEEQMAFLNRRIPKNQARKRLASASS